MDTTAESTLGMGKKSLLGKIWRREGVPQTRTLAESKFMDGAREHSLGSARNLTGSDEQRANLDDPPAQRLARAPILDRLHVGIRKSLPHGTQNRLRVCHELGDKRPNPLSRRNGMRNHLPKALGDVSNRLVFC